MAPKKDDDESKDLTRIEDLSEFLHQKDSELDSRFDDFAPKEVDFTKTNIESEPLVSLDGLEDDLASSDSADGLTDFPPDLPNEESENNSAFSFSEELPPEEIPDVELHQGFDDSPIETTEDESVIASFDSTDSFNDSPIDSPIDSLEDSQVESSEEFFEQAETHESMSDEFNSNISSFHETESTPEPLLNTSEKFDDVKTFAHNFSYGKSSGVGGNPPFSIIARNIRYEEDAESILDLLEEFGVMTAQNEKDIKMSLDLGTLLIPQISEYMAIVLAHKLRRFDLDLEVGLSDEVHPSKSGDSNPRGLIKKENLKQNKLLQVKLDEIEFKITDIILSTTNSIEGYKIDHYLGIESCFAIVDEDELERLNYVQQTKRQSSELIDYQISEDDQKTTKSTFEDYQESFNALYDDLKSQLRQKALLKKANALLGFNYQVSPVQFDKGHQRSAAYHITCSATLASISKEAE